VFELDRTFVRDIETDPSDAEISAATLALAQPGQLAQTVRLRLFFWANALWSVGEQRTLKPNRKGRKTEVQHCFRQALRAYPQPGEDLMNNIVYIVGFIVIVLVLLSFFGLR
jgi:small-conductance mechanosensitive channel